MSKPQAPGLAALNDRVREVLDRSGAVDALDEALTRAQLDAIPELPDAILLFFEGELLDALIGRLHPATARGIVDELLATVASGAGSGTRLKSPSIPEPGIPTVPPPAIEEGGRTYDDLASGAVHTRPTPVWGIPRASAEASDPAAAIVWVVVSTDAELTEVLAKSAPAGAEILHVSAMADLMAALAAGDNPASSIVIDALHPSVPLDQAVAALIEEALTTRIVIWRMEPAAHELLLEAVPVARTWLACEAEVTPAEIVQLLGVV